MAMNYCPCCGERLTSRGTPSSQMGVSNGGYTDGSMYYSISPNRRLVLDEETRNYFDESEHQMLDMYRNEGILPNDEVVEDEVEMGDDEYVDDEIEVDDEEFDEDESFEDEDEDEDFE